MKSAATVVTNAIQLIGMISIRESMLHLPPRCAKTSVAYASRIRCHAMVSVVLWDIFVLAVVFVSPVHKELDLDSNGLGLQHSAVAIPLVII
jgi:hypothetical protein